MFLRGPGRILARYNNSYKIPPALGDKDLAFAWLEKDFQAHSGRLSQIAHFPMFENLWDDPRFQDLLLPQN